MKKCGLLFLIVLLGLSGAWAQTTIPKHMVIFGHDTRVGFAGSATKFDPAASSAIDAADISQGNLSLNYAYSISQRFQLGFILKSNSDTTEIKGKNGITVKTEESDFSFYVTGTYNFNDDFFNSFYLGALAGVGASESEATTTGAATTKQEIDATLFGLYFGKRFTLKSWGIENLVYSPRLQISSVKYGKDYKTMGLEDAMTVDIQLVSFDLLF